MVGQLWAILTPRRRKLLVVVLAIAMLAAAAEAAVVLLIDPVVRALVTESGGPAGSATQPLVAFAIAIVGKNLLVLALSWFKNRELFAIQADVSQRLLETYIRGSNPAIRDLDAGQRTSFALTEPLQLVLNGYQPLVNIAAESLALLAVAAVLIADRPLETTLLVAVLTIGVKSFSVLTRARVTDYGTRRKDSDTRRAELVRAVLESRIEVSGLGASSDVIRRYRAPNRESAAMTARKSFLTESAKNVLELLVVAAIGPLAVLFVYAEGAELLPMLAMFGMAAYRAMPALNRIIVSSQSAKFGAGTARTIHSIFDADAADLAKRPITPVHESVQRGCPRDIEFAFDNFRLRNGKQVLQGRTIRLTRGDLCIIWGASGSGKSTLLEALVEGGDGITVRVGDCELPRGLSELAGHVGMTAQTPLLLSATLEENLALGRPEGPVDLGTAAGLLDTDPNSVLYGPSVEARLRNYVHRHSISGGQAQRISLIRALDQSRSVVLLDEPTSALDARAAAALRERILEAKESRIVIIATHDAELRAIADKLLEL